MNQTLLQQIDTMRKEMVAMVEEQGDVHTRCPCSLKKASLLIC